MGIPSYYKKLVDKIKGLVVRQRPEAVKALYFDFNCLIYYVVRRPQSALPVYPGEDAKYQWEGQLIDEVVRYTVKIWEEVGKPASVFLGLDGVVPMAKIRQQRLRRFKSIWLAKEERALGQKDQSFSWDTNCITPGTAFMARLGVSLTELCLKRTGWSVSTTSEPGEGEHKVMNRLRALQSSDDPIVIYGLDADLVLLTLLNSKSPAYLMREDQDAKDERYAYLSTDVLKKALWPLSLPDQLNDTIRDYVAAMTLLGNDFLPHSLTVKIKEDGHTFLLSEMSEMKKSNLCLLELDDKGQYRYRKEALLFLFERWALKESDMLLHSLKRKLQMRGRPGPENVLENRPLEWAVERSIVQVSTNQWSLLSTWKEHYTREWLLCDDADHPSKLYLEGLQWTLDYYTGQKSINTRWYFPFYVPPLWTQLASYTAKCDKLPLSAPPDIRLTPIEPQEQLAMVLPLESWHLLEKAPLHLRTLPSRKPYYWPSRFDFFSAGRLWMWECEPLVPILRVDELRGKNL